DPKTQKFKPFQDISQRIRRKYDISQLQELVPVQICVFDIIQKDADVLIDLPFKERRAILEKHISPKKDSIELSSLKIASNADEINAFYQESLAAGNEGLMLKSLDSPYKPGSRVGFMMKLKPIMDTLDLVITQATWGEGKRASWLTSFVLACVDENGQLQEVGRVGTGFKELTSEDQLLSFEAMTQALEPLILERKGKDVFVKPQIILEIAYEEIQKSNSYSSGYALRFPRVVSLKDTRSVENATGIDVIEDYFFAQQKRT
ncbi:MAG TPA: DNA ligase, partial [Acidobacteriota bacterium]|nr:DNA ligase [Acidobacteriota bacterium]